MKWIATLLLLVLGSGCKNVESLEGNWEGGVSQSRLVRRGLDFCTVLHLKVEQVDSASLKASFTFTRKEESLSCSPDLPEEGETVVLPSQEIQLKMDSHFLNDDLSGMTFSGKSLFTHLAHATIPAPWGEESVVVLLSFHVGGVAKVKFISRNIYAAFYLEKTDGGV